MSTSPFQNAIAAGMASLDALAGMSVTYRRGAAEITVTATPGESVKEVDTEAGINLGVSSKDWLMPASALDFGSGAVEPERGDEIVADFGNGDETFQVMPQFEGDPLFRYSDHGQTRLRIHTKRMGVS